MNPTARHELTVKGMSCLHCVKGITRAIQALDTDAVVAVDLASGLVQVQSTLTRESVAAAIQEEGYEVIG